MKQAIIIFCLLCTTALGQTPEPRPEEQLEQYLTGQLFKQKYPVLLGEERHKYKKGYLDHMDIVNLMSYGWCRPGRFLNNDFDKEYVKLLMADFTKLPTPEELGLNPEYHNILWNLYRERWTYIRITRHYEIKKLAELEKESKKFGGTVEFAHPINEKDIPKIELWLKTKGKK